MRPNCRDPAFPHQLHRFKLKLPAGLPSLHGNLQLYETSNLGVHQTGSSSTAEQQVVGLLTLFPDVDGLGLDTAQGLLVTESSYWDMNDEMRACWKRFFERNKVMPHLVPAGVYGTVMHYLKTIKIAGTIDSAAVMKAMKDTPINDIMTKNGRIREDGRALRDFYVFRVKSPKESKGPWNYDEKIATIPAENAARRARGE